MRNSEQSKEESFSMDGGDIGAQMTSDLIQCIQEHSLAENFQSGGVLRLFA